MKAETGKFDDFLWEGIPLNRDDIYLGICKIQESTEAFLSEDEREEIRLVKNKKRKSEMIVSRMLLKHLAAKAGLNPAKFSIKKTVHGKPEGFEYKQKFPVSISHTGNIIAAVLSTKSDVGLDIELKSRKVHERLQERILHDAEKKAMKGISLIRIWTIKESILKLTGTGLRMRMSAIQLQKLNEHEFSTQLAGHKIKANSFVFKNLWVSVSAFE